MSRVKIHVDYFALAKVCDDLVKKSSTSSITLNQICNIMAS